MLSLDMGEINKKDTLSHCLYVGFKTILGFCFHFKAVCKSLFLERHIFRTIFMFKKVEPTQYLR